MISMVRLQSRCLPPLLALIIGIPVGLLRLRQGFLLTFKVRVNRDRPSSNVA